MTKNKFDIFIKLTNWVLLVFLLIFMYDLYCHSLVLFMSPFLFICLYTLVIRPYLITAGALDSELHDGLPLEDSTAHFPLVSTQVIQINKPKEDVWRWLVQIGQGKAGFYNPNFFEKLLKIKMENRLRLNPIFQRLTIGEKLYFYPTYIWVQLKGYQANNWIAYSYWYFQIKEINPYKSRLICRLASPYKPNLGFVLNLIIWHFLFEIFYFCFTRNMLRGIKTLSESSEKHNNPDHAKALT